MKIIYGIKHIKKFTRPVVALGVFDGVHRGHQKILKAAVAKARQIKGKSIVLSFWPHPQKEDSLYSLAHRLKLIAGLGIEVCIVIKFSLRFAQVSAEDFVKNILCRKLHAGYIYIGKNFRFGQGASGDAKTLKAMAGPCCFKLRLFDVVKENKKNINSSFIRTLIRKGDLALAEKLLGRAVSVLGTVTKGISLAAKLGFPTANINPHHEVLPPRGIYAVKIIFAGRAHYGVCYIGKKPTFRACQPRYKRHGKINIEVHIFDFKKNLYGKDLEVSFYQKLREERRFVSPAALSAQVQKDVVAAKKIFSLL
jgi:riboflavin kinase/FMN adenylyltransferase